MELFFEGILGVGRLLIFGAALQVEDGENNDGKQHPDQARTQDCIIIHLLIASLVCDNSSFTFLYSLKL